MLSHELRSPLGSIRNAIGVLRGRIHADAALQQRMHALIERQVRHMTLLVADLLAVSRTACGHPQLRRERIDACVVLSRFIETVELDLRRRNQRLSTRWPETSMWLSADADRLEQVFVNLLANASKYTDPGGEIALSVDVHDSHVVVRVRDSGIGIAPHALPHIFDLFMQVDAAAPRSRSENRQNCGPGTERRSVACVSAGSAARSALWLQRLWPLRTGARSSFQPGQVSARSLREWTIVSTGTVALTLGLPGTIPSFTRCTSRDLRPCIPRCRRTCVGPMRAWRARQLLDTLKLNDLRHRSGEVVLYRGRTYLLF